MLDVGCEGALFHLYGRDWVYGVTAVESCGGYFREAEVVEFRFSVLMLAVLFVPKMIVSSASLFHSFSFSFVGQGGEE